MKASIAQNVRRYRALKGLNQGEAAELAGISRNAYRAIETGASEPRSANLERIAKALDVSVMSLLTEVPVLHSLRFRSLKTLTAQQRALRQELVTRFALWLKDYNELEALLEIDASYLLDDIDAEDPETAASDVRQRLGLTPDCPVVDLVAQVERAGIKLLQAKSRLDRYNGLSVSDADGGPAIGVNTDDTIPVERQIFSTAHEIGHLVLHRDSYDGAEREEDDQEEKEANCFAAYFLMPAEAFDRVWNENRGLHFVDGVMKVKRHFQVSYQTVLRRLIDRGEADGEIWRVFPILYKRRYNRELSRKREPIPLAPPDFEEDRLDKLVRDALEKERISLDRAAEILDIDLAAMRERVRSWQKVAG